MLLTCRKFLKDGSGAAGAEMALLLPLILILMFGSFELGHYFWSEHKVVKGVRDGARFAARQPFARFSCNSTGMIVGNGSTSPDAATIAKVKNLVRTGQISGGSPKIVGWTDSQVTITVSCPTVVVATGIYEGLANAPRVNVSATEVVYPSLFRSLGFQTTNLKLNASAQAAVMGI